MVLNRSVVVGMGLAAGAATAVTLYATAASPVASPVNQPVSSQLASDLQLTTPEPTVSYSPCTPPAQLEHGVCVTHKVVTKVVPVTVESRAEAQEPETSGSHSTAPRRTGTAPSATHHEDEVNGGHEDADHEDADHGDAGHGDEHGDDDGGDD